MKVGGRGSFKIWRRGLKKGFRGFLFIMVVGAGLALPLGAASGAPTYQSLLKKWTRNDGVYVWDNFEARMIWYATYLSEEFRDIRRDKIADLYEWSQRERAKAAAEDRIEAQKYEVFFVGFYAGSSQWPEIGKDDGKWRIVLQTEGHDPVDAIDFKRISVTQLERTLYPYLDKWSHAYLLRFPKVVRGDDPFRLRMTGLPAKSELVWK
jgi:hypothetical protein